MYKHILLLIFTSSLSFAEEYPTVCLEQGGTCYKGSWLKSPSNNVTYATFQGIKYAQPPVGELRLNFSMILVDKYLYRHGRYDIPNAVLGVVDTFGQSLFCQLYRFIEFD